MDKDEMVFREVAKAKDFAALQIMVPYELHPTTAFLIVCEVVDWPEALRWLQNERGAKVLSPSTKDAAIDNSRLENLKYLHYEGGSPVLDHELRKILLKSKTPVSEWALSVQDYDKELLTDCLYDAITVGNPRLVKAIHRAGGDINEPYFCKAVVSASFNDAMAETIKYLNSENVEFEGYIYQGFKNKNWEIINELINSPNFAPEAVDWEDCLFYAVSVKGDGHEGNWELIKLALKHKPSITISCWDQAARNNSTKSLQLLLDTGATIDEIHNPRTIRRLLEIIPAGSEQAKKLQGNLFKAMAYGKQG